MRLLRLIAVAALLAICGILAGCSQGSTPKAATEQPKPAPGAKKEAVLYTAQECLKQLEGQAKLWTMDAQLVHVESDLTSEAKGHNGKSAIWRAMYVSGQRSAMRTFTCSGSRDPAAPAFGLSAGIEGPLPKGAIPFQSFLIKADSDKAFEVAQGHGGETLMKRNPDQPVVYVVEMARGDTVPHWYVIYGENLKLNKGVGVVNATTAAFVRAR